ncbi:hypothetical protein HQ393_01830 [Chitinibacter bivalviorum]|uniref:Molecular chaperone n=1 Tax=Chitinibacter bivalviorum TaxID=2739434 RepID=A0A7H9BED1_9NEIS|nr:hypothetical protein [Chitinibacter bivalviorum]QLG87083.1 hypothetical protein HQ393_01830 [Chitinibacter bivalviorum]
MIELLIQRALPALGGQAEPPFQEARSARDWLKLLPMINVPVAHGEITQALALLNQSNIEALNALKIVEQFRESAHTLQEGMLSKLIGKALPLNDAEQRIWDAINLLWRALETSYARIWHAACKGQDGVAEFLPLLAERTLYYSVRTLANYAHIYRKPSDKQWRQIFSYYELAKAQHIEKLKARDSMIQISGISTPESMFVHALLFDAANPHQYSFKQQIWLSNRLELLATRSGLTVQAEGLHNRAPLCIDMLAPAAPERRKAERSASELEIETQTLAQVLSKRIKLLRMGEMPEKLGLGNDLGPVAVEEMLRELYKAWCDHPTERSQPRRPGERYLEVGLGLSNLHRWLAKDRFSPPPQSEQQMSSAELMQIRMFGQTSTRTTAVAPLEIETQQWAVSNETAQGMCLHRNLTQQRVHLSQLLLIADGKTMLVGKIRWISDCEQERELGIQLIPGAPQAASVRAQDAARFGQGDFTDAILLGATPALKSPASLLLPPGWFRQGRLLEYWDGQQLNRIRLVTLLERGVDYERVHFVGSGGLS